MLTQTRLPNVLILYHSHCWPPYRAFVHSYKIQNGDDIWPNLRRFFNQFTKVKGIKTWKELTIGAQQLVRLLFNNNLSTSGLSFKRSVLVEFVRFNQVAGFAKSLRFRCFRNDRQRHFRLWYRSLRNTTKTKAFRNSTKYERRKTM